ncbi:MAG: sigma-70 family RNA polymerase sigma factor [Acidobacteria bacterium]|jgi:RNA polymerase primary sigma factor|nr:sigma-70 family RNA polymerase sigma factor [Acidobacteriota bacterium]
MKKKSGKESLDSLNLYFQQVKKISILNPDEEKELIQKVKDGDEDAFQKIIVANQKLVVKEALKYYFKEDNFLDLVNEGNKGLIEALKRFDPTRENRFYTYALWWVRSEIRRYLSKNQKIISFPDIFYNNYLNFKKVYFNLNKKLKRRPTEKELAKELGIPEKKVKVLLSVPDEIVSLDKTDSDDDHPSLSALIPDKTSVDPQDTMIGLSTRDLVREDVEELTEKEAQVIKLRYGFQEKDAMKLREIAKQMSMSPEGIRRIELKALKKLKDKLRHQGIYGVLN